MGGIVSSNAKTFLIIYRVRLWRTYHSRVYYVFNKDHKDSVYPLMASKEKYSVDIKGYPIRGKSWLVQTWLIDMIYDVACLGSTGSKIISQNEGLHLIALYNDYQDNISRETSQKTKDVFLYVFGFFCEQKKIQNLSDYIDIFTREKYS